MIWAGRLNAITVLVCASGIALLGLTVALPIKATFIEAILGSLGLFLAVGALVGRLGFAIADLVKRAFYGEPLIYDQKLQVDRQGGGQISE